MYDPSSQFEENVPPTSAEDPYTTPQSVPSFKPKSSQFTSIRPSPHSLVSPMAPIDNVNSLTPSSFRAVLGNQENRPLTPLDQQDESQVMVTEVGEAFRAQVLAECAAVSGFAGVAPEIIPMESVLSADPAGEQAPYVDVSESFRQQVLAACSQTAYDSMTRTISPPPASAPLSPLRRGMSELITEPMSPVRASVRLFESGIKSKPLSPSEYKTSASKLMSPFAATASPAKPLVEEAVIATPAGPAIVPITPLGSAPISVPITPFGLSSFAVPVTPGAAASAVAAVIETIAEDDRMTEMGEEPVAQTESEAQAVLEAPIAESGLDAGIEPNSAAEEVVVTEEPAATALVEESGAVEPMIAAEEPPVVEEPVAEPSIAAGEAAVIEESAAQEVGEAVAVGDVPNGQVVDSSDGVASPNPGSPSEGRVAEMPSLVARSAGSGAMQNSHASAASLPSLQPVSDEDKSKNQASGADSPKAMKKKSFFCFCC